MAYLPDEVLGFGRYVLGSEQLPMQNFIYCPLPVLGTEGRLWRVGKVRQHQVSCCWQCPYSMCMSFGAFII